MQNISDNLGVVVKTARLEKRMTQKQLAARVSISSYYLRSIENKKRIPSCELLFNIVRELDIPTDKIFHPDCQKDTVLIGKLRLLLVKYDEKEIDKSIALLQLLLEHKSDGGELGVALHK